MESKTAAIILEDGTLFAGDAFGFYPPHVAELSADNAVCAELIFNTAMTGYVEILTDPSYAQQMVLLTTAHVGNYGVDLGWNQCLTAIEDSIVTPSALIVHELYLGTLPDNRMSLVSFLEKYKKPLIAHVDTRGLTRHIRDHGAQQAMVVLGTPEEIKASMPEIMQQIQQSNHIEGNAIAEDSGVKQRREFSSNQSRGNKHRIASEPQDGRGQPDGNAKTVPMLDPPEIAKKSTNSVHTDIQKKKIVLLDCGIKQNILAAFSEYDCIVLPCSVTVDAILKESPDAVLVSNGPGDPSSLDHVITVLTSLVGKTTLFGICLGHQLIAHALGAQTYKLPFGHHGANHAVRDEITKRVHVVSENHGFAVDETTLPASVFPWFRNTSDGTLEGIYSETKQIYSVQFHPEAGPGPHDGHWIFSYFKQRLQD